MEESDYLSHLKSNADSGLTSAQVVANRQT